MRNRINIIDIILDLLFPPACPVCDKPVPLGEGMICLDCRKYIVHITDNYCKKCGRRLKDQNEVFCKDCNENKHVFDEGRALYDYSSISKSIFRYKYLNRRDYGKFYASEICKGLNKDIKRWNVDAIIPVPLHTRKKQERGFNQAELIAKYMGKELKIPVKANLVKRQKYTVPQKKLDILQRQNNLKNAFHIDMDDVKLKRVLVVDDIYTTGSTVDAIASKLKEHGVGEVYYVTLSIGEGL